MPNTHAVSPFKRLVKNTATVGAMTMVSRALGFVRDILIALFLGAGPVADAFVVAFRLPNLSRHLFAEGAFNAAFVPLFSKRYEAEGLASARGFAESTLGIFLIALSFVTISGIVAMPWVVKVLAPGFVDEPDKFETTVLFARITFPYLLFISLVALYGGMLNSLGRFSAAAAMPVLLNITLIGAIVLLTPGMPTAGHALAYGVAWAGILQFLVLAWAVRRAGLSLRLPRPKLTPSVRRFIRLVVPGVIAGGITQINTMVGTMIASLEAGAVSYLYYSERVYQLPLGLIGGAIGVVLLPTVSRQLRAGETPAALSSQNRALELSMLLTLPATAALLAFPLIIVTVLFERGAFDAVTSQMTASALSAFAIGLPAFVLIKVFSPGFFAREDTRTPMIYSGISVLVNVSLGLVLFFQIGFLGIPIATSIASWLNAGMLAAKLIKLGYFKADARLASRLPRILLASVGMGLVLWYGASKSEMIWVQPLAGQIIALVVLVVGGIVTYGALALLLGAARLEDVRALVRRS